MYDPVNDPAYLNVFMNSNVQDLNISGKPMLSPPALFSD